MTDAPPLPPAPARPSPLWAWALLLLALVPYGLVLGEPPLWDANEPLYAEPPREALETGDWLAPPRNGAPWFVHPPLSSWLTMPFYAALGPSPFAERLPMALAAMATVLATGAIARRLFGARAGLLAALVLAATPRFWLFARQLAGDVYLTALLCGAIALALPALEEPDRRRRRLLAAHALAAVAVLAKGPLVVLGLYALPLLLAARLGRPRVPFAALRPWSGLLLATGLGLSWFGYMAWRFGRAFVDVQFGWNHWGRMVSDDFGGRPFWFYAQAIAGDAQPFLLLLPFAIVAARRRGDRSPSALLPWLLLSLPFLLFSLVAGKRNVYLMPVYPALAVVLAPVLGEIWDGARARLVRWLGVLGALACAGTAVFLYLTGRRAEVDLVAGGRPLLAICTVAAVAAAVAAARRWGRLLVVGWVAVPWSLLVAAAFALPGFARYMPVPRLAGTILREAAPDDLAVVYATSIHSLGFYARRPAPVAVNPAHLRTLVPPGRRAFVLTSDASAPELLADPGFATRERDRAPYVKLQFAHMILGERPPARELVLLEMTRAADPPLPPAAPKAPQDGPPGKER